MKFELMHPAEQIVMIMDRIYRYGMTTTSGGNLSIMDSDGDLWITPGGIDKGSLTVDDIMQIKPDGTIIGRHKPSSELPFHRALMHHRKGTRAVLHAHPPALVAFSIVRQNPKTDITTELYRFYQRGGIKMAKYEIPGSELLGDRILEVFSEDVNAVMLENHGVVIASDNLFDAFKIFETLEFGARLEINSNILGQPRSLTIMTTSSPAMKRKNGQRCVVWLSAPINSVCSVRHRALIHVELIKILLLSRRLIWIVCI